MTQALQTEPATQALSTARAGRVARYVTASKAENTRRMYRTQWATFEKFCAEHVDDDGNLQPYNPLPAQPAAVVDYIAHLADEGRKASSIQQALAAIGYMHENAKHYNPAKSPEARATMAGIRRTVGIASTPKAALSPDELRQIVVGLPDNLRGIRDRALLLMGWAGAFRRSELVALDVADVDTRGGKMTIAIRRSKTDQSGEGNYKVLPAMADSLIDPLSAYRTWLKVAGIAAGPVFRGVDRWGHTQAGKLHPQEVARVVKAACKLVGIDEQRFAGHSLRSGFVTAAANAGASDADIAEQTHHRSSATLRRYKQLAGRGAQRATLAAFGVTEK